MPDLIEITDEERDKLQALAATMAHNNWRKDVADWLRALAARKPEPQPDSELRRRLQQLLDEMGRDADESWANGHGEQGIAIADWWERLSTLLSETESASAEERKRKRDRARRELMALKQALIPDTQADTRTDISEAEIPQAAFTIGG